MAMSDADLTRSAIDGNVASLGILLERHRATLYATALHTLGDVTEAQDAVQDVFLIAVCRINQVREPEAVGGWLRAIIRRVCYSRLRQVNRELFHGNHSRHFKDEPAEASLEETLDRLALRDWIWAALSELPEALRVKAMLRYFGSYPSYDEIATILGVPVGTIRSRIHQVKIKLAEALLNTANMAHDDARGLNDRYMRFFASTAVEINRGNVPDEYIDMFAPDVEGFVGEWTFRGRQDLAQALLEDFEDGVKVHPTRVLACTGVIVMEGRFESPPDDPFHCPPRFVQVAFSKGGKTHHLRVFHAQRLVGEPCDHQEEQ